jgi:hypothetical protein
MHMLKHFRYRRSLSISLVALLLLSSGLLAMQRGGWGRRNRDLSNPGDRDGVPMWEHDENFAHDSFTFARVIYNSYGRGWGGDKWRTDYPESDLNFSLRLQQLTSLKVNPIPTTLELTDPRLFDYPFLYMIEVGGISLNEAEMAAMRKYCMSGGFIMIDDFWGDYALVHLLETLKRVFPDRQPYEVPLEHEIFQCVYPLKEKPQIPSIHSWLGSGQTYERHDGDTRNVHYLAINDDAGRIAMFICHNTDLGDGWEQEGVDQEYFREFAVKKSYPLGINIVTYAMTH